MGNVSLGRRGLLGLIAALSAAAAAAGIAIAAPASDPGVIGPTNLIQPNGRQLDPAGTLTQLGNAPAGGELTPNGRYLWTLSAGRGPNDIRIVEVRPPIDCRGSTHVRHCRRRKQSQVGRVVQTIIMPGVTGGIAMDPSSDTAYVSGVQESAHKDEQVPNDVPGQGGDVIHVFTYDPTTGQASRDGVIPVPPPSNAPPYQDFPPQETSRLSWPAIWRSAATAKRCWRP